MRRLRFTSSAAAGFQSTGAIGGFLPAVVAGILPVVLLPGATDTFVLPRAAVVISAACLGTALVLVTSGARGLGAVRWPLLIAAAAALLAFAFSISWPLSLAGSYTRYESLPVRLSYLGLLASTVWLLRTDRQRDLVAAAFVAGTSIACIKAWIQFVDHVPWRPDGDLGNANLLAALVVMAIPLAIDRARRNTKYVPAWAAALLVLAAGLYVTTSRSGDLGLVAGCLALLAFSVPRRFAIPVAAFSLAALTFVLLFFVLTPIQLQNGDPPQLRLHLWSDGLRMVAARPITGYGEDTTGLAFGHFLSQNYAMNVTFDRIHSGPLDIAATQGLLGLTALGWVLAVLLFGAWRHRSERNVAGLAAALVGYTVWVLFNFDWVPATGAFWLLAGALWNAASARQQAESAAPAKRVWQPALAAVLVLAVVLLAVFPILSEVWQSRRRADLAVRFDPLQAQYHWVLGTVAEMQRAADLGETEPGMYVTLGDLERQQGHIEAARRAYLRALEIDPYYSPAIESLTNNYASNG